jgi:Contractile injection system tube protein
MIANISNPVTAVSGTATGSIGTILGPLMNLVPTPGKLVMIPVKDFGTIPEPAGPPYIAMFNPENWQIQTKVKYRENAKPGDDSAEQNFDRIASPSLSFDLVIDGTGASGEAREVLADVLFLEKVILFNGEEHQTNKIFIIWGTQIFKGVALGMTVKYTLFRANGTPLRATITLEFLEHKSKDLKLLEMNPLSADLSRRYFLKNNDRLDLLCHYIYKNARHYIDVAQANNLTSFRKLPIGTEIVFPPIEK